MSGVQIPPPPPAGDLGQVSPFPCRSLGFRMVCKMGVDYPAPPKAPTNRIPSVCPALALSCRRLERGTFEKSLRGSPSLLSSRQSRWWRREGAGRWHPRLGEQPASSEELGAPRFSAKPPFHGLIEYLNNPFIPARHKECCPNSGDSGRRPRAQWPLEWGCYSGCLLLARSSG